MHINVYRNKFIFASIFTACSQWLLKFICTKYCWDGVTILVFGTVQSFSCLFTLQSFSTIYKNWTLLNDLLNKWWMNEHVYSLFLVYSVQVLLFISYALLTIIDFVTLLLFHDVHTMISHYIDWAVFEKDYFME